MIEVCRNLFVGTADEYDSVRDDTDFVSVLACKDPFHRAELGYTGKGAPRDNSEYFLCKREGRLILNLVDVVSVLFISPIIIDVAVDYIRNALLCDGRKVFICCNKGESRSPTIALLAMANTEPYSGKEFDVAIEAFKEVYPAYNPNLGMFGYARQHWDKYMATILEPCAEASEWLH